MSKLRVGVLRGGPSSQYDMSLKTGGHILRNLSEERYVPQDIFISRDGIWHVRGREVSPERALKHVDVVFNGLHGEYGEDGAVQKLLDSLRVPYTGSRAFASALAINKVHAKDLIAKSGIRTPLHTIISYTPDFEARVFEIFRSFPQPVIIKPIGRGASIGVVFADSYNALLSAVEQAFEHASSVMVEEYIRGREVTCGVIDNFREEEKYTLLPVEILLEKGKACFDFHAKQSGACEIMCPSNFSSDEKLAIRDTARRVHEVLGLNHYSRSDFIMTPRGIYFLEVNTLPGLDEESLVLRALSEAGCTFSEFVDHLVTLAVEEK